MGKNEKVYKYIFWGIIIITFFSIMINSSTRDFFVKVWTLHDLKIKKEKMINEATGRNIQYFLSKPSILLSSRYSVESASMWSMMSVPRSVRSASSIVYSGLPSQDHLTALVSGCQLFVMISTFSETMNAE